MDRVPKMTEWSVVVIVVLAFLLYRQPHLMDNTLYKLAMVAMGGVIGYWFDRRIYPESRPSKTEVKFQHFVGMRRAIIVSGAMLSTALVT